MLLIMEGEEPFRVLGSLTSAFKRRKRERFLVNRERGKATMIKYYVAFKDRV